jgi:hypothetical protein
MHDDDNGSTENENAMSEDHFGSVDSNMLNNSYRFVLVHKRWEVLYTYDRAPKLKEAMKRQL